VRADVNHALQRASGEIHFARMGARKCRSVAIRPNSQHEVVANDAAADMAIDGEGQAAEHP
jgi:hypothetical protein